MLTADPRIVDNPKTIGEISYEEVRELSYSGATVLHEEALIPVLEARIPIVIRNTNRPKSPGTHIVPDDLLGKRKSGSIVGVAGRNNFTLIRIRKVLMNREVGYVRQICSVLESYGVSFEHIPSGIDSVSLVIANEQLRGNTLHWILEGIKKACAPTKLVCDHDLALICSVGQAMYDKPGVAAKLLGAVARAKVNVKVIDQGSSENNIIIGVSNKQYETALRAIHRTFFGP